MKKLWIVCEGQSEVTFCKHILVPYFADNCTGVTIIPITVRTGYSKATGGDCKGGCTSFSKVEVELKRLFAKHENESNYITTMLDMFKLPGDFPHWKEAMAKSDAYEKVKELESAFYDKFNRREFIPYIQLHEFEALTFSDLNVLKERFSDFDLTSLENCLKKAKDNPELINTCPENAPSKRILKATQDLYDKVSDGKAILSEIGIDMLMSKCRHFREWIEKTVEMIKD